MRTPEQERPNIPQGSLLEAAARAKKTKEQQANSAKEAAEFVPELKEAIDDALDFPLKKADFGRGEPFPVRRVYMVNISDTSLEVAISRGNLHTNHDRKFPTGWSVAVEGLDSFLHIPRDKAQIESLARDRTQSRDAGVLPPLTSREMTSADKDMYLELLNGIKMGVGVQKGEPQVPSNWQHNIKSPLR